MTDIEAWAARWNVPHAAVVELRNLHTVDVPATTDTMSEAGVQSRVRVLASQRGTKIMRNNVGVLKNEVGTPVRFGLMNDSKALNEKVKSSDLIGLHPVLIQPWHVGHVIGQFIGYECKPVGWVFSGTPREKAQAEFISMVNANGGHARFISDPRQIEA